MAIPVIYKGDDTDFRGSTGFTLKVVTSSNLNLSGCTVEVEVLGYRKSFPASATGELVCPFAFTAAETQRMPLGIHAATVRVYDSKGRVRTINNSIRVKVTNSVPEAYGKDDPQEVTLAVSTVDLETYAKKDDVTAAIEKALKDAGASVKLHALTPEVTDTTVTLKPVDGAANYVNGKIALKPSDPPLRELRIDVMFLAEYDNPDPEGAPVITYHGSAISRDFSVDAWDTSGDEFLRQTYISITTADDVSFYDGSDAIIARIPKGTQMAFLATEARREDESFADLYMYIDHGMDAIQAVVPDVTETSAEVFFSQRIPEQRSVTVHVPVSTDDAKARRFSLAVETDVETEKAVEWQGGEVVEALPGASKLVPGLTVWDVSEVAPGKFRVDRASSPAQSVPLTLTAPNGRVAELTVNDDLVLEVKEK